MVLSYFITFCCRPSKISSSAIDEEKFIVFSSCLLELFDKCCRCHSNRCEVRIASRSGTCIAVEQVCNACNYFRRWSSQPNIKFSKIPAGNILLAGSIMLVGYLPRKRLECSSYST